MNLFQEGGVAMVFIAFFGVLALVAAILHAAFARRWSFVLGVINVPIPPLIGLGGWLYGCSMVEQALAWGSAVGFAPEIAEQGYAEARIPLYFGLIALFACAVPFAIGVARQLRRLTPR